MTKNKRRTSIKRITQSLNLLSAGLLGWSAYKLKNKKLKSTKKKKKKKKTPFHKSEPQPKPSIKAYVNQLLEEQPDVIQTERPFYESKPQPKPPQPKPTQPKPQPKPPQPKPTSMTEYVNQVLEEQPAQDFESAASDYDDFDDYYDYDNEEFPPANATFFLKHITDLGGNNIDLLRRLKKMTAAQSTYFQKLLPPGARLLGISVLASVVYVLYNFDPNASCPKVEGLPRCVMFQKRRKKTHRRMTRNSTNKSVSKKKEKKRNRK